MDPVADMIAKLRATLGEQAAELEDEEHRRYEARMAAAERKQAAWLRWLRRKSYREAEQARRERRAGKTYGPDPEGRDPFRGLR